MEQEKVCNNCRYCQCYYVRHRLHFVFTGKSECVREKKHVPIKFILWDTCPHWESLDAEEETARRELGLLAFGKVVERIDELIVLLKEE